MPTVTAVAFDVSQPQAFETMAPESDGSNESVLMHGSGFSPGACGEAAYPSVAVKWL